MVDVVCLESNWSVIYMMFGSVAQEEEPKTLCLQMRKVGNGNEER